MHTSRSISKLHPSLVLCKHTFEDRRIGEGFQFHTAAGYDLAWVGVNYSPGDDQASELTLIVDDDCKCDIGGFRGRGISFTAAGGRR